jgi:hypothetical protein
MEYQEAPLFAGGEEVPHKSLMSLKEWFIGMLLYVVFKADIYFSRKVGAVAIHVYINTSPYKFE